MPLLTPINDGSGGINYNAALEQMAINHTIYFQGPQPVIGCLKKLDEGVFIGPVNSVWPDWSDNPAGVPPFLSWVMDGQIWVNVVGTYTASQWTGNVIGALFTPNFTPCGVRGQGYWIAVASAIAGLLNGSGILNQSRVVNVVGHSLGAAVAFYLGYLIKAGSPSYVVNVLTLACPHQTLGSCNPAAQIDYLANLQTTDDPVANLPPNLPPPFAAWVTNGVINVIRPDGTLAPDNYNVGKPIPPSFTTGKFEPHFPRTYYDSLKKRYDDATMNPPTQKLLTLLGFIAGLPVAATGPGVKNPGLEPFPEFPSGWKGPTTTPDDRGLIPPLQFPIPQTQNPKPVSGG